MKIKVKNSLHDTRYANQPRFHTYEGEVVPTPKWVSYDAVCLTTDDKMKFRIISTDMIIEMNGEVVNTKPTPKEKIIMVDNGKGTSYTVIIGTNNKTCNCTGFGFRKTCKHIAMAEAA